MIDHDADAFMAAARGAAAAEDFFYGRLVLSEGSRVLCPDPAAPMLQVGGRDGAVVRWAEGGKGECWEFARVCTLRKPCGAHPTRHAPRLTHQTLPTPSSPCPGVVHPQQRGALQAPHAGALRCCCLQAAFMDGVH